MGRPGHELTRAEQKERVRMAIEKHGGKKRPAEIDTITPEYRYSREEPPLDFSLTGIAERSQLVQGPLLKLIAVCV